MNTLKQRSKSELWSGIFLVVALFFMLFIYAPTEMYCYNSDEFWFDYYKLFPVMLVLFLAGCGLGGSIMVLTFWRAPKLYRVMLVTAAIAYVCTYVQGNFLVENLPPLDGSTPDWTAYGEEMLQSVLLWLVVAVVAVVLYKRLQGAAFVQAAGWISMGMTLMLTVTMVSVLLTTGGYETKMDACATVKDQYVFSEDSNFIILMLDSVDAGTLSEMLEENPAYKEVFEDFTYYENMMGAYSCTEIAVPQILSGIWYENERPIKEYVVEAYNTSPFLAALEQQEYLMGMYEFDMPYEDENIYRFSNVLSRNSRIGNYLEFAKLQIMLVGYRYAPFPLKPLCLFSTESFGPLWESDNGEAVFIANNRYFYDSIQAEVIATVPEKCFKFIHAEGAHAPFCYDEALNPVSVEEGTYRDVMKASLTLTREYLDKLKSAGVYDNSVIIIMADHGYAEEVMAGEGVEPCENRQNPIFFVKTAGEQHELRVSQAPVSYDDLQEAFARLLDGRDSGEIFDYQEDSERTRRYIYYDFVDDRYMYEYTSTGHASDDGAMKLTGNEYIRNE